MPEALPWAAACVAGKVPSSDGAWRWQVTQKEERGLASSLCHRKVGFWVIVWHEHGGRSPGLGGGDRGCPGGRGSRLKWCESADGGGAGGCAGRCRALESVSESDWTGETCARVWAARQWARLEDKGKVSFIECSGLELEWILKE